MVNPGRKPDGCTRLCCKNKAVTAVKGVTLPAVVGAGGIDAELCRRCLLDIRRRADIRIDSETPISSPDAAEIKDVRMKEFTMDGVWDDGGGLEVGYVGVDLSEAMIKRVIALNRDNNAFTHTVEAESETEAFRVLAEEMDADSVWDCRHGKPRKVYTLPEDEDGT